MTSLPVFRQTFGYSTLTSVFSPPDGIHSVFLRYVQSAGQALRALCQHKKLVKGLRPRQALSPLGSCLKAWKTALFSQFTLI